MLASQKEIIVQAFTNVNKKGHIRLDMSFKILMEMDLHF